MLTLALEDAVNRGEWLEAQALLIERQTALDETTSMDNATIAKLVEADQRLHERFQTLRSGLLGQMTRTRNAAAANKLYRRAA